MLALAGHCCVWFSLLFWQVVAVLLENDTRGKIRLPALHIAAKKDDTKAAGLLLQVSSLTQYHSVSTYYSCQLLTKLHCSSKVQIILRVLKLNRLQNIELVSARHNCHLPERPQSWRDIKVGIHPFTHRGALRQRKYSGPTAGQKRKRQLCGQSKSESLV